MLNSYFQFPHLNSPKVVDAMLDRISQMWTFPQASWSWGHSWRTPYKGWGGSQGELLGKCVMMIMLMDWWWWSWWWGLWWWWWWWTGGDGDGGLLTKVEEELKVEVKKVPLINFLWRWTRTSWRRSCRKSWRCIDHLWAAGTQSRTKIQNPPHFAKSAVFFCSCCIRPLKNLMGG